MRFTIIFKIARSIPIRSIREIITSLSRFNTLVVPLTKMSSLIFRVRFFQGLRNGNLSKILLPCFNRRKYGVTQSTRGHPMEKTVPGWCTQRRWRVTGRQDHALTSESFKVGSLIKITARIGTTLDHFNRGLCPAQVIHVNQNEIGGFLGVQGKRNYQS